MNSDDGSCRQKDWVLIFGKGGMVVGSRERGQKTVLAVRGWDLAPSSRFSFKINGHVGVG
jgi:hypothetical protein